MLYAMMTQYQDIQTQLELLNTKRSLNTAEGVQLDGIGEIVGLARIPGQSDEDYREALQFQIFVNQANGTPEDVIAVLKFLNKADRVWYWEVYPAAYQMAANGLVFPNPVSDLPQAIQSVSPAGVNFIGVTATYNTTPFSFSTDPFNEQLYVANNPIDPFEIHPFQADPGTGAEDFFVNRGATTNPELGGAFAEAILISYPIYEIDTTGAGQLAEVLTV